MGARHPRPAPPPATGAKYRERVRRGASRLQWQSHGQYEGCSPLGLYYSLLGCYRARRGKELIVYLWINWKHQHADWAQNWLGLCWTICTSSSSSESMSRPRDSSAALFCVFVSTFYLLAWCLMTGAGVMMSQSPHPAAISRYLHDWLLVTVLTGRKAERSKPLASWWPCCMLQCRLGT